MLKMKKLSLALLLVSLLLPLLLSLLASISWGFAQTDPAPDETLLNLMDNPIPARDPIDLAERFQGLDPATLSIALRPAYQVGDREQFFIGGIFEDEPRRVTMDLVAAEDNLYMWFEQGLRYNRAQVERYAEIISERVIPRLYAIFAPEIQLGIEIQPTEPIYILNVRNAGPGILGLYNDTDSYPNEVFPTSNEISSLIMATSPTNEPLYLSVVAHELQHLIQARLNDNEETWIIEGLAELGSWLALPEHFNSSRQAFYVRDHTTIQLTSWPYEDDPTPYYGGGSLFLTYLVQRYGEQMAGFVAQEAADGAFGIEAALDRAEVRDSETGAPIGFNDVFADFVIANYMNDPSLADGRYYHKLLTPDIRATPTYRLQEFPVDLNELVNQYGTHYITLESRTEQTLEIDFQGSDAVALLPVQPYNGDYYLWSQRGNQGNAYLQGRFDLSEVSNATLSFWTWYEVEAFWDYGYLTLSTDNGETWLTLNSSAMTDDNRYGRAFGAGYTGSSGGGSNRPAPYIGISYDVDMSILEVSARTPASEAGLLPSDRLIAVDGQLVVYDNFFRIIDHYQPNDTVILTLHRNGQNIELPLTFTAHPSRIISEEVVWQKEAIDLSPYSGAEVLIRFDYVTDQATSLNGWLIDDFAIPEIGFQDSFEDGLGSNWEAAGWVAIQNSLPQDYILQLMEQSDGVVTVQHLIMPDGGENSGRWTVQVGPGRSAVLAISGATLITDEAASYRLSVHPAP